MLQNFKEKVEAEFTAESAAEQAAIAAYNEEKARLTAAIDHLTT